jgi:hypothetical protein
LSLLLSPWLWLLSNAGIVEFGTLRGGINAFCIETELWAGEECYSSDLEGLTEAQVVKIWSWHDTWSFKT